METIKLSSIGGVNNKILQRVIAEKQVFLLTYYGAEIAYLAPLPFSDELVAKCKSLSVDTMPTIRAMRTSARNLIWRGEVIGVTTGRSQEPAALLIPTSYKPDEA